jgi:hypothetical protein
MKLGNVQQFLTDPGAGTTVGSISKTGEPFTISTAADIDFVVADEAVADSYK